MNDIEKTTAKKKIWLFLFLIVWCAQMLAAVYFCCQKKGFHEDEYYTYYSTSRTYGLIIEDGAWMEHDQYFDEFVVLDGQGFQYGLVKLVQSWDVHPPVYYWIFHTVSSLFPGQFSKWFGLVINLTAYGATMFLLRFLALQLTQRNEELALLICFFYGFTPAVMSSVVFIRMYALLTVFIYLCVVLHIKEVDRPNADRLSVRTFLLPLAVVTYLGFLTQYYYFIFLFFMAAAFCIYLLGRDRNLWNCVRYGCSVAAAFVLAWLTYPSCLGQMFRGQRGAQATGNFFDLSNTMERLAFFWQLLDEYVFGKILSCLLLFGLLFLLYAGYQARRRKIIAFMESSKKTGKADKKKEEAADSKADEEKQERERNPACWILLFAITGYFIVVAKTALLLGNTSIRYQMPIYGMIVLLLFMTIEGLVRAIGKRSGEDCGNGERDDCENGSRYKNILFIVAAVLCLIVNMVSLFSGHVVFLYPEDESRIAFAKEKAKQDVPVVCLYDAGQSWCVWDCADEFFAYDRIYFASLDNTEPIKDDIIANSRELVVYLSNGADAEEQIHRILESNPKLTEYELREREKYLDVYYFYEIDDRRKEDT